MSVLDLLAPSESSSLGESVDMGRGCYRDELNDEGSSQLALTPDVCSVVGFSSEEVSAALHCLKSGRAPGPDLIPAEMLKYAYGVVPEIFEGFFNACLWQGVVPKHYKIAELCPILKDPNWDPQDKSSLRPISLLPAIDKWLEDLMVSHLTVDMERKSWLDGRQFGFVAGRGTDLSLIHI